MEFPREKKGGLFLVLGGLVKMLCGRAPSNVFGNSMSATCLGIPFVVAEDWNSITKESNHGFHGPGQLRDTPVDLLLGTCCSVHTGFFSPSTRCHLASHLSHPSKGPGHGRGNKSRSPQNSHATRLK